MSAIGLLTPRTDRSAKRNQSYRGEKILDLVSSRQLAQSRRLDLVCLFDAQCRIEV